MLGDLGLAASIGPGGYIIKRAGTVPFMAPEVIRGQPASFPADIWSLGIILYAMVCNHLPFPKMYYEEKQVEMMLKLKIPFKDSAFETVDESCIDLMRGMLQKDWT